MDRLKLTRGQQRQLVRQLRETRDAGVYRRTLGILEYSRGRSAVDIATSLGVDRRSLYNWIEAYSQNGDPRMLRDEARSGRPRLWTQDRQALLRTLMQTSPNTLGYAASSWTVPLLREQIEQASGKRFSDQTIRDGLRQEGYVWKRPRYRLEPDPNHEKKTLFAKTDPSIATQYGHFD